MILAVILQLLVVLGTIPTPAAAAPARGFAIERLVSTIRVDSDGSFLVSETITFAFRGAHQGVHRSIPVRHVRDGLEYVLRIDGVHVLDTERRELQSEVSRQGDYLRIKAWVPGAVDAQRTIVVLYRVRRGLLPFEDHDELYWNATGDEWTIPIGDAEVVIALPRSVPGDQVTTLAFTGGRGAPGRDYVEARPEGFITFRTTRPLRPREGLTVVVGWPPGHVARPDAWQRGWWMALDNWPLGLPLLTLVVILLVWRAYGRDAGSSYSIKPEYEPPRDLTPAEAGTLVDERVDGRDIVATLVDLAVRGYLHVERVTDAFGKTDYLFKRLKPIVGDGALTRLEVFVLARVFGIDWALNLRLLSEIRRDYDTTFPAIRAEVYRTMVERRLFPSSPYGVRRAWAVVGIAALAAGAAAFTLDPAWLPASPILLAFGLASSGVVVLALAGAMPRRTWRGARLLAQVRGFQEFLERAERDRLERLPPDTLHRWLPWAMALGVTERWILAFEGLKVDEPSWYTGDGPFTLFSYDRTLTRFGQSIEDAILTTRRSPAVFGSFTTSYDSGFSRGSGGGGFSGGGGGTF